MDFEKLGILIGKALEESLCSGKDILIETDEAKIVVYRQPSNRVIDIKLIDSTRVVNIKNGDEFDVFIGRPSRWGNPYKESVYGRDQAVFMYEEYARRTFSRKQLLTLKNLRLGCYCHPLPCHGDVLIKLVREL